jgi:hypothetical protein
MRLVMLTSFPSGKNILIDLSKMYYAIDCETKEGVGHTKICFPNRFVDIEENAELLFSYRGSGEK